MEIQYSNKFKKQYKKLPKKTREKFHKRLISFLDDQNNAQLNIHKLAGKYEGLWSINITGNIRAVIDKQYKNVVIFEAIGSHPELYS